MREEVEISSESRAFLLEKNYFNSSADQLSWGSKGSRMGPSFSPVLISGDLLARASLLVGRGSSWAGTGQLCKPFRPPGERPEFVLQVIATDSGQQRGNIFLFVS